MTILSIDLGKFKSVFCTYRGEAASMPALFATHPTDPDTFRRVIARECPDLVVFETSTVAGWVADVCEELGLAYQVANPMDEAWSWRKVKRKTDRDDALKLARMAARGELPVAHMPPRATRQYRLLVKYRARLVERRVAIQNHLRAVCQQHGILLPTGHAARTKAGLEVQRTLSKPLSECGPDELWRGALALEIDAYEALVQQLDPVEKKLDAMGKADARVRLLETIPGIGRCTAEVIVSQLDDPRRFRSAAEVSGYAGLVPRQFQSGEMDRRGRITKRGPALLRKTLVEAAWMMVRCNPWADGVLSRISRGQKTRRKQALVALARKLLVRCWAMLRDGVPWKGPPMVETSA